MRVTPHNTSQVELQMYALESDKENKGDSYFYPT